VSHTGLVTKEGGEVNRSLGVILNCEKIANMSTFESFEESKRLRTYLGETLCLSTVSRRTLARQETKGTATKEVQKRESKWMRARPLSNEVEHTGGARTSCETFRPSYR